MLEVFSKRLYHAIQYNNNNHLELQEFIPGTILSVSYGAQNDLHEFVCKGGKFFFVRPGDYIVVPAGDHKPEFVEVFSPERFVAWFTNDTLFGDLDLAKDNNG